LVQWAIERDTCFLQNHNDIHGRHCHAIMRIVWFLLFSVEVFLHQCNVRFFAFPPVCVGHAAQQSIQKRQKKILSIMEEIQSLLRSLAKKRRGCLRLSLVEKNKEIDRIYHRNIYIVFPLFLDRFLALSRSQRMCALCEESNSETFFSRWFTIWATIQDPSCYTSDI